MHSAACLDRILRSRGLRIQGVSYGCPEDTGLRSPEGQNVSIQWDGEPGSEEREAARRAIAEWSDLVCCGRVAVEHPAPEPGLQPRVDFYPLLELMQRSALEPLLERLRARFPGARVSFEENP
jgi:hypothetical protein